MSTFGPRPERRRVSGFTLIELIAVIAIIAVVMMIAVVRMDYLIPKYRLRGAAREVGAAMRQGRARAVATGRDVFFEIDLSHGNYWLLAAFPRREEDELEEYWKPLEEREERTFADPLLAAQAEEDDRSRAMVYEPIFVRSLPGEGDGIEFVSVIFGQEEVTHQGIARIRLSPFGASEHAIINLVNRDGRQIAVKMNGFTGNLSFYGAHQQADLLLQDDGF